MSGREDGAELALVRSNERSAHDPCSEVNPGHNGHEFVFPFLPTGGCELGRGDSMTLRQGRQRKGGGEGERRFIERKPGLGYTLGG